MRAALVDINKTLLRWLNKQRPSLNALVHIMDATHLVAFTPAHRIAVLVEGGLIGMVRRDGHQAGLSWDQSCTSIRVRDARQRPEARARRHGPCSFHSKPAQYNRRIVQCERTTTYLPSWSEMLE